MSNRELMLYYTEMRKSKLLHTIRNTILTDKVFGK